MPTQKLTYRQLRDLLDQIDSPELLDAPVAIKDNMQKYNLEKFDGYALRINVDQMQPAKQNTKHTKSVQTSIAMPGVANQPYVTCYDPLRGISYDRPWH